MTMLDLIEAAREARKASTGGVTIWITIVEEGLIVSGGRDQMHLSIDIAWPELDMNAALAQNAVWIIAGRLAK